MKIRTRTSIFAAILAVFSAVAVAGTVNDLPVTVTDNGDGTFSALGNMVSARFTENDVEYIGCGTRTTDLGGGNMFEWAFCQAGDSAELEAFCSTENPELIRAVKSISDYSFISFGVNDVGECWRVGVSTQSFYIPSGKDK